MVDAEEFKDNTLYSVKMDFNNYPIQVRILS